MRRTVQRRWLMATAAAVILVHLWVLGAWRTGGDAAAASRHSASTEQRAAAGGTAAWRVSVVSATPQPPAAPALAEREQPVAQATQPASPADEQQGQTLASEPAVQAATPQGTGAYLPRHLLTVGPHPEAPVIIGYPPDFTEEGQHTGQLALFIDEHGTVRRVEALDARLSDTLLAAARSAFLAARFRPGELSGQPVRARIEIEVTFEALP